MPYEFQRISAAGQQATPRGRGRARSDKFVIAQANPRYGIWIREGYVSTRLFSLEFRRVRQYERAGSITLFLPIYLQQIDAFGYRHAPFEREAREHEIVS